MKISGLMKGKILTLILLTSTLALSIVLPISPTDDRTLVESISGRLENHQERKEK